MSKLYVDELYGKSGDIISFPDMSMIKYIGTSELAGDTTAVTTSTSFVDTGAEITIPSATVAELSKIIIFAQGSVRINKNTHAFADFRIDKDGTDIANSQVGVVSGGTEVYMNAAVLGIDDSLGSGDHVYKIRTRKAFGNSTYAANIYYKYQGWRLVAVGI